MGGVRSNADVAIYDNRPNAIPDEPDDEVSQELAANADGYLGLHSTLDRSSDTGTLSSSGVDATNADKSGEYLTLPRSDATLEKSQQATLIPEVYSVEATEDGSSQFLNLQMQSRSRSYDNALNDV